MPLRKDPPFGRVFSFILIIVSGLQNTKPSAWAVLRVVFFPVISFMLPLSGNPQESI
ncbi:hypothetical protein LEP1GSC178_0736 [Leptospira licerasiae str. MMD4847]|uniref:Uncharacterized protein n=1 Tax=Leptospira licerasiae str. MMD4847 TaxID=1049971 RepID=A0ABP2R9W3_9LEPT|nr:hypothetical protein LEP1GSC178_0736 [Leptospira licerasiae str. MMD4847]